MFNDTIALTTRSLKKWVRNPAAIMPGVFMAVFWLALFGSSFNPVNLVPSQVGGNARALHNVSHGRHNHFNSDN